MIDRSYLPNPQGTMGSGMQKWMNFIQSIRARSVRKNRVDFSTDLTPDYCSCSAPSVNRLKISFVVRRNNHKHDNR